MIEETCELCQICSCKEGKKYHIITDEEHFRTSRFMRKLGGDNPRNRVLECIVSQQCFEYSHGAHLIPLSVDYICDDTLLDRNTVEEMLSALEKEKFIVKTNEGYTLRKNMGRIKGLINLIYDSMAENLAIGIRHELHYKARLGLH